MIVAKEKIIDDLKFLLAQQIDVREIPKVVDCFSVALEGYDIVEKSRAVVKYDDTSLETVKRFFLAKAVEGLSPRSLKYYKAILGEFFLQCNTPLKQLEADEIRIFLAKKKMSGSSDVTINNIRRVLSSFFGWCSAESIIPRNPILKIKKIKTPKKIKKPFSDDELEILRLHAKNIRERAIIEFLFSTGCRIAEMCSANRTDIDWQEGTLDVFGKGKKYRTVYLSSRCKIALQEYLKTRKDDNEALFMGQSVRLGPTGIEKNMRDLGMRSGIENVHPHRFRRTAATTALRRGMPIEQVQQMLGHESIATTTIYAQSTKEDVKISHEKYIV